MADVDNNWSLFGLDLTRSGKWLALGVHQLLFDRDAWLLQRFEPSIRVSHGGEAHLYRADAPSDEEAEVAAAEQTPFSAVALSADAVLLKTLHLPASTEEDLDEAMPLEVGLSSPFPDADTRAAWRVARLRAAEGAARRVPHGARGAQFLHGAHRRTAPLPVAPAHVDLRARALLPAAPPREAGTRHAAPPLCTASPPPRGGRSRRRTSQVVVSCPHVSVFHYRAPNLHDQKYMTDSLRFKEHLYAPRRPARARAMPTCYVHVP